MNDEAEVPPPQIWILWPKPQADDAWYWRHDLSPSSESKSAIQYVPASALNDAWDTAIKTLMRAADECPVFVYHSARGREFLIEALAAARDAALSVGKGER